MDEPSAGASIQGAVVERDGQTVDRSGVGVTVVETASSATTGADGTFRFDGITTDTATLQFDDGSARIDGVEDGERIEVRCSVREGRLVALSVRDRDHLRAEARLARSASSPDLDVEGKVRIETRPDREKLTIEAERLAPGTIVEFLLDGDFVAALAADESGRAELERNTNDGDVLPLGASRVEELSGVAVAVRLSGGETLLEGTVPELPTAASAPGDPPGMLDRARGRARLVDHAGGLDGYVEIRSRPEHDEERFDMEAEHLAPGTRVAFLIEDPNTSGAFQRIATRTAGDDGEAEVEIEDGPLPAGASRVAQLVGLEVRVVLDDGTETVLLSGEVPPLVAD